MPEKDKLTINLKHALDLLRLRGLKELKNYVLALKAFFKL